jgi:hypothetical protein
MESYARVIALWEELRHVEEDADFSDAIVPELINIWLTAYEAATSASEIVEVPLNGFSYLFDIRNERLVAAWGVSQGPADHERDASRMRGHPMSAGDDYHRGHAIAHSLGGGADINLVPQRGSLNVGAFRELERRAIAHPGSLYFTHWLYEADEEQTPRRVEQGLLAPGHAADIRRHDN